MDSEQNPAADNIGIDLDETFIESEGAEGKEFYYSPF